MSRGAPCPARLAALAALLAACGGEAGGAAEPSAAAAPERPGRAWFEDATAGSGVDFVHDAGTTPEKHLPETMGAGAALVDVDADGDLDLYFVQGGPMPVSGGRPGTFAPPGGPRPVNRLYLGDGDGRFVDATASSGAAADPGYGMGVAYGDVNGDGHVDLYVTNLGPDVLLLGDGAGGFTDGTRAAGLGDERWTSGACLFDADADGDLDLYVSAYVEIDVADPTWCGGRRPGWRSYCHPDHYPGLPDRFWRNDGAGRFTEATAEAGLSDNRGKGLGVCAEDFDDDGILDLYVANDSTENRLWLGLGGGRFTDGTLLSGTGVNERGMSEAGMGIAAGDADGDGDLDLVVTNFDDESNTLYVNEGGGLFRDGTVASGLEGPSRMPVGFGVVLEDLDLDGDLDLAVANGHIIDNIHLTHDGKTHAQRAQLFVGDGSGRFVEDAAAAGALGAEPRVGRGLYAGDLDGDGDLDLVATVCGGPAVVLRNVRPPTGSLHVEGPRGTRVEVLAGGRSFHGSLGPGPSYFGQSTARFVVGLAAGTEYSVRWRLPGGEEVTLGRFTVEGDGPTVFRVAE